AECPGADFRLLRLLTGLARPDGGEVYWQGEPLRRVRDSFHSGLLWIGHQPGIKTRLTARENLHFFHPGDGARLPEALAQAFSYFGFERYPLNGRCLQGLNEKPLRSVMYY
ncbi:Cytochrome c heme lyase subunit CcmA, partial [Salmonella enterica subsp. enterica serovar Urbana str. R8-2977]